MLINLFHFWRLQFDVSVWVFTTHDLKWPLLWHFAALLCQIDAKSCGVHSCHIRTLYGNSPVSDIFSQVVLGTIIVNVPLENAHYIHFLFLFFCHYVLCFSSLLQNNLLPWHIVPQVRMSRGTHKGLIFHLLDPAGGSKSKDITAEEESHG